MSGPKTSEYTLTPEQRANLNAQNRCDGSILACIERIKSLQNQVAISMGSVQIYDDCGNDESVALTNNLKEKMQEIERLKKTLSDSFETFSGYQRGAIILSDEELRRKNSKVYIGALCPGPVDTEFNKVAKVSFSVKSMKSYDVAKYAIKQMFKRKLVIVPSLTMKLTRFVSTLGPTKIKLMIAYNIQKSKLK